MPDTPKIPKIFAGQPLKYTTSNKHDGHTSFGKVSDAETTTNITRWLAKLSWPATGYAFHRITYAPQRTYDEIRIIDQAPRTFTEESLLIADGLVTTRVGIVLQLPTADCYPVTLFDPKHKVLALVHLGWHSTQAHLLQKVIALMQSQFQSNPANLLVHFGPGIPAKYYVHKDPVQLKLPGWQEHLHKTKGGYEIDLLSYNLEQLSLAGIDGHNIELDPRNTVESDELESHHMHTKQGLPTARRFLTAVMLA